MMYMNNQKKNDSIKHNTFYKKCKSDYESIKNEESDIQRASMVF